MSYYGFWLLPPKNVQDEYQEIINYYSRHHNTPSNEPHISILNKLEGDKEEIISTVSETVNQLAPLEITVSEISFSSTYFQCVFARIKPTVKILDLHLTLRSALKYSPEYMFVPHLSLVYGNLTPSEKQSLATEIKLKITSFKADRICIVNADTQDPQMWTHLAEFELKN